MEKKQRPDWGKIFQTILTSPGKLGEYYRMFHSYSLGNQALAMEQMTERGIPIGPIASFNGWKKLGRSVKKGEKAIALWMPVVKKDVIRNDDGTEEEVTKRFFVMKNNWFALSQTEGDDTPPPPPPPGWDKSLALASLGITEVPFEYPNGNVQGFARPEKREVSVSPIAALPWKTLFHEIAHCLMHNKEAEMIDGDKCSRSIQEAEAEAVALLCCATLGLPGAEESRAYIQGWLASPGEREAFGRSAAKIFRAADEILKAGIHADKEEGGSE